jgi:L-alanine-DL-glutamate epimerase-like enolase superfamily enzyme
MTGFDDEETLLAAQEAGAEAANGCARSAPTSRGRDRFPKPRVNPVRCAWQESNLRPCAPEAHALSPELQALGAHSVSAVELAHRTATLRLAQPFTISRSTSFEEEVVWVELRHDGVSGWGEAQPQEHYGESVESVSIFLEEAGALLGDDPFALEAIGSRLGELPANAAARAALDAALHDLCGKLVGLPVWRMFGLAPTGPPTSWTIWLGDPDDMARRAESVVDRFRRLKLKLGGRDGLDVERVRAVRSVTELPLQVDVNEYWELDEALDNVGELAQLGVHYVEQPLPAGHPDGADLKKESPLPIYVDEDCLTLADVAGCAERAHGINIKLAKSGGIREAVRMAHAARALDLGVMLGCMIESGLGIAAACQLASLCDHVDLDGNLLLAEDPWPGVELREGVQVPSNRPGLGVDEAVSHPR